MAILTPQAVIPAEAGISCGSCAASSPEAPAFAGVTGMFQ